MSLCVSMTKWFLSFCLVFASVLLFFNCSQLYFSSEEACLSGGASCGNIRTPQGNTDLLFKPPVDILLVMDNTETLKPLNPSVAMSLNAFLKCIEPLDWRLGLLTSAEKTKNVSHSRGGAFGDLLYLENQGRILPERYLSLRTKDYEDVFSDSVSLTSGCEFPPYCGKGASKPLSAIKAFASSPKNALFLREQTPLVSIIVSSTDEEEGIFSKKTFADEALTALHKKDRYYIHNDHLMNVSVTASGTSNDCIKTTRDVVEKGMKAISVGSLMYSLIYVEPLMLLGSVVLSAVTRALSRSGIQTRQKKEKPEDRVAIADLAHNTGGYLMDLCNPDFGKALAYVTLQHVQREDLFSRECQTMRKRGFPGGGHKPDSVTHPQETPFSAWEAVSDMPPLPTRK